jgi:ribosomal protein S18 acetylase RimI-like enzyme
MLSIRHDSIEMNWNTLVQLIDDAGLGKRDPAVLERVFRGSFAVCYAYEGSRLVGAGRAISDGVTSSAIYDVVVSPDCQGRGIGRQIAQGLLSKLPPRSVMLLSVPGQRGFYERLGFKTLKTAMMKHEDEQFFIAHGYMEYNTEPDSPANGSQPIRSEANSTSPAAGSRR